MSIWIIGYMPYYFYHYNVYIRYFMYIFPIKVLKICIFILLLEMPCPSVHSSRFLPHPRVQSRNLGTGVDGSVGHTA